MFADRRERRIIWNRRQGQDDVAPTELEYFNAPEPCRIIGSERIKLMTPPAARRLASIPAGCEQVNIWMLHLQQSNVNSRHFSDGF
jgi:hypothetical protein